MNNLKCPAKLCQYQTPKFVLIIILLTRLRQKENLNNFCLKCIFYKVWSKYLLLINIGYFRDVNKKLLRSIQIHV